MVVSDICEILPIFVRGPLRRLSGKLLLASEAGTRATQTDFASASCYTIV
jgi:hypothetical protein